MVPVKITQAVGAGFFPVGPILLGRDHFFVGFLQRKLPGTTLSLEDDFMTPVFQKNSLVKTVLANQGG